VIRRAARPEVPEALRRYLTLGDYESGPGDLGVFTLAGSVMRGRLTGLRAAWTLYGPEIRRTWPIRAPLTFAERVLETVREGDTCSVLAILNERRAARHHEKGDPT